MNLITRKNVNLFELKFNQNTWYYNLHLIRSEKYIKTRAKEFTRLWKLYVITLIIVYDLKRIAYMFCMHK